MEKKKRRKGQGQKSKQAKKRGASVLFISPVVSDAFFPSFYARERLRDKENEKKKGKEWKEPESMGKEEKK